MTSTDQTLTGDINGVPTTKMFGTIAKLTDQPDLAAFRFTARNQWINGTASASTIHDWHGVGTDHVHGQEYTYAADHPTLGHGHGPTPHEFVLHALASCITAGVATGAAARKIELDTVTSTVSANMDVRGVLGIDADIRKGFRDVTVSIDVQADADDETIDKLIAAATKYSAVYDILTNPTPVEVVRAGA